LNLLGVIFSPILPIKSVLASSTEIPLIVISLKASILFFGLFSKIANERSLTKLLNSSFFAQKSVSELTSRRTPVLPLLLIDAITAPSAAIRPDAFYYQI